MTCGSPCYGDVFTQTLPKIPLVAGRWQDVVIRVKTNTPGLHDGDQILWIDGQKKIDIENMRWRNTTDLRLNEFALLLYMPGAPITEHVWFDNIVVWIP
jgi:hypothetical protein